MLLVVCSREQLIEGGLETHRISSGRDMMS